jgi:hypothetical protein
MDAMCDCIVDNLVLMLAQRAGSRINFAKISSRERYVFLFFFVFLFAIVLALAFFLEVASSHEKIFI